MARLASERKGLCFAQFTGMPWHSAFRPKQFWALAKAAASDWSHDRAPRLGATLAYSTVFSIVPPLIIAIIGLVFGRDAAQAAIIQQIAGLVGDQSAAARLRRARLQHPTSVDSRHALMKTLIAL